MLSKKMKILDELRKLGLDEKIEDAAGVKAFIAKHNIVISGVDEKSIDSIWSARTEIKIEDDLPTVEQKSAAKALEEARAATAAAAEAERKRLENPDGPQAFNIGNIEAKSYKAKLDRAFETGDDAAYVGAYLRLRTTAAKGIKSYPQMANDLAIVGKTAGNTTTNSQGGAVVFTDQIPQLQYLTEKVGVARRISNFQTMGASDRWIFPRMTSIPTFTFTAQNAAATEQMVGLDNIELNPRTAICYVPVSNQLLDRSAISISDILGRAFAEGAAIMEDDCYINGDGTPGFGNMKGLKSGLRTGAALLSTSTTWAAALTSDLLNAAGKVENVNINNCGFLMSRQAFIQVCMRLASAFGGNTNAMIYEYKGIQSDIPGSPNASFLGWPVWFSQRMPTATASGAIWAYFGDFKAASYLAVGKDLSIAASSDVSFNKYRTDFRAVEDIAVNIATDGKTGTYGPIVSIATN